MKPERGNVRTIHHTAIIHENVQLGKDIEIGPYVTISDPNVVIGDRVSIKSHVVIQGPTQIGEGTVIWPFASIGGEPQHLTEKGNGSQIVIGKNCQIREYVTVNLAIGKEAKVIIGDDCMLMAYSHVAHNCKLGKGVILTNGATLAGHVEVGEYAVLGGLSAFHQHTRVGAYAMVGGGSMVGSDIPPFCLGTGYPLRIIGLNMVGLRRKKFSLEQRRNITQAYRITLEEDLNWKEAHKKISEELEITPEISVWVEFCKNSKRGLSSSRKHLRKGSHYSQYNAVEVE